MTQNVVGRTLERIYLFGRGYLDTQDKLSEHDVHKGIRFLTLEGVAATSMITLQGGPFLAAFAIGLGASHYDVGLLVTIGLLSQVMQIPGLYLVSAFRKRKAVAVLSLLVSRLSWVPIVMIPFLFVGQGITFFMHWLLVAAMIGAVASPAWNSWMREVVPPGSLGAVFGNRLYLGTAAALLLTLGGGLFIDRWEGLYPGAEQVGYAVLFGVGLACGLGSLAALAHVPEPRMQVEKELPPLRLLLGPLQDVNFRSLLGFVAGWNFAFNLASPFFILYMLRRLELSMFAVTVFIVIGYLANILFLRVWGKFADRYSNKSVLGVSVPLALLSILAWTFTTLPERHALSIPFLASIHVLSGMSLAGVSVASMNIALKLSPVGRTHSYVAVYGLAGALAGAAAPLVGGAMADFFAARGFSVSLAWQEPAEAISVYAVNVRELDFLFFFAFLVGLASLRLLAAVREEGEVDREEVREHLLAEVVSPFRLLSTVPGVRHLVAFPIAAIHRLVHRRRREHV